MKKILLTFLLIQCIASLKERKITMYSGMSSQCLKDDAEPKLYVYFESEGTGFTEEVEFEMKFVDVEYIPTKCAILKDGDEFRNSKMRCIMDMTTFGVPFWFHAPKEPPTIKDVTIEGWNYEGKGVGMCTRDHSYLFTPSENYKTSCTGNGKTLEIQGKMKNTTQVSESANIVLNVEPYVLVNNKAEKVICTINFDGTIPVDNGAKMKCQITLKENKGRIVMTNSYEKTKKYYVGIGNSIYLELLNCESSSWFIKGLGILLINILLL